MRSADRFHKKLVFMLAAVLLLAAPGTLGAQEEPDPGGTTVEEKKTPPSAAEPRVTDAWNAELEDSQSAQRRELDLNAVLDIEVAGLGAWLDREQKSACDVRLYLDGRKMEDLEPVSCAPSGDVLSFDLWRIDRGKEEAWTKLLLTRDGLKAEDVSVSVGISEKPLSTDVDDLTFLVVHRTLGRVALVGFIVVLVLFLWLAKVSNMIRDPVPVAGRCPYSLARSQMAWWFFLVLGGFLFLILLTGGLPEIPGSILGLMGISAGTFLAAEFVGAGNQDAAGSPSATAKPKPETDTDPSNQDAAGSGDPSTDPAATPPPDSLRQYFLDILAGPGGLAFHRFQIAVWTLALGIIFMVKVSQNLAMPDFDANLLGLMGISAGTYVGFKFPEKGKDDG